MKKMFEELKKRISEAESLDDLAVSDEELAALWVKERIHIAELGHMAKKSITAQDSTSKRVGMRST